MDESVLRRDETVLLRTPEVSIKSAPFEAILTDQRLVLFDRKKGGVPCRDISLASISDLEPGENAIRDPTLTLSVRTDAGETRRMILTFPRYGAGGSTRTRDEWADAIAGHARSPAANGQSAAGRGSGTDGGGRSSPEARGEPAKRPGMPEGRPKVPIETISPVRDAGAEQAGDTLPGGSYCTRCGTRLPQGSAFCNRCGTKVIVPVREVAREELPAPGRTAPARRPAAEAAGAGREDPGPGGGGGRQQPEPGAGGLLSRLVRRKRPGAARPAPPPPPAPDMKPPGNSRKKILISVAAAAVILIALAGAALILSVSPGSALPESEETPADGGTPIPAETSRPPATATTAVVLTERTPPVIPAAGVYVRVSYIGAWRGSYGMAGALLTTARSGEVVLSVDDAAGTVQASFRKDDASTRPHELVVEIYRNGALVKRGVTTGPKGQVTLSVNVDTATPITVVTTAAARS